MERIEPVYRGGAQHAQVRQAYGERNSIVAVTMRLHPTGHWRARHYAALVTRGPWEWLMDLNTRHERGEPIRAFSSGPTDIATESRRDGTDQIIGKVPIGCVIQFHTGRPCAADAARASAKTATARLEQSLICRELQCDLTPLAPLFATSMPFIHFRGLRTTPPILNSQFEDGD